MRAALTSEHVRSNDRLARFVGVDAYEAAGGNVLRDLFAEDDATFFTDRPLLLRLVGEKLETVAEEFSPQGWKWAEISIDGGSIHSAGYGRIYPERRDHTDEEQAESSALAEAFDELAARIEAYAEGDPEIAADEARLAEIEQRIEAIRDATESFRPEEQALAGCLVAVAYDGSLQVTRGLVKPEDRKALDRLRDGARNGDDAGEAPALPDAAEPAEPSGYSATLIEELTAVRTAALRVELANRPEIALAAMLHPLVLRCFHDGYQYLRMDSAVEIRGERKALDPCIKEPEACRALAGWKEIVGGWGHRLPGDPADLWEWLIEQPTDVLTELLAVVTAANLNAVSARYDASRSRIEQADQIARTVALDMRAWWTPDAEFLAHLSKSTIASIMREAGCSEDAARAIERAPKAEAVAQATRELDGKGWLPSPLTLPDDDDAAPAEDRNNDADNDSTTDTMQIAAE
ncbi:MULTISPECIES: hypothetical protein [unclassified Shinella]|uniref:hypothetical protein n=1 Tax=unclassified Shinella TaxID=2643062 RepID=UPI00225CA612|nr:MULTISPECIES: hypothetical protein [unclassified Shinella]CAI0335823.1 hypothetical protein SHINE37_20032 [Rhizobiaceae bacterium]CAK7262399.1 protein of unknown function [Shinella sp. WSC3-e]MDC7260384.1 hypothetical protein [Shinella sp. YE25]MDC7267236.1 hypothetical protein [Shinella sp. HY16]MDC7274145.1 hypothetical protein [Shinella sp. YZ44]